MSIDSAFRQLREANPIPDPALLTDASENLDDLLVSTRRRSSTMQTRDRVETTPSKRAQRPKWLVPVAAAAALAAVIAIVVIPRLDAPTDVVDDSPVPTPVPTTVPAPLPDVDIESGTPVQVVNDQGSRVTLDFAGDARLLVEGGVYEFRIDMEIEADFNSPSISVNLTSTNGEVITTGMTSDGAAFTPTWSWTPDGDKVVITMVGRGVSIPDTRPSVIVTIRETAESAPVEFVLTAAAGTTEDGS